MNAVVTPAGWQLDASGPKAYERYLVPRLFAPWAEHLIDFTGLASGERVLDVACGTGIVARRAAARLDGNGSAAGIDLNENMLAVAREASPDLAIEWGRADAVALPYSDSVFDVCFCQQALQFLPDRPAAIGEMARVLAPGGRLGLGILRSIERNPGWEALAAAMAHHAGEPAGAMMRSPFAGITPDEIGSLLRVAGFEEVRIRVDILPVRYRSPREFFREEAASSPMADSLMVLPAAVVAAIENELANTLRVYSDDDGIVFPSETYMVSARCAKAVA